MDKPKSRFQTLKEFLDFFEAIPADRWCVDNLINFDGRRCALGHVGETRFMESPEAAYLRTLAPGVVDANDGMDSSTTYLPNRSEGIKDRVITYLKSLLPSCVSDTSAATTLTSTPPSTSPSTATLSQ